MRPAITLTFVVLAGCPATTTESGFDPPPAGSMRASAIGYDNTLSGLLSTTVQSALDDLAVAGAAHDERIDAIETKLAAGSSARAIVCKYSAANAALLIGQNEITHTFTAAECGGTLPGPNHVGALARFRTCASSFRWVIVANAGEAGGPGITFYREDDSFCAGSTQLAAVFSPN
jgi:hypothetical protein